jgi:hypothetical protein
MKKMLNAFVCTGQKNIKGQKNTDQNREGHLKKTKKFLALYGSKVFGTDEL